MMEKDKVLSFEKELSILSDSIDDFATKADKAHVSISETQSMLEDVASILKEIPDAECIYSKEDASAKDEIASLNDTIDELSNPKLRGDFELSGNDIIVAIIAGIVASVIDIVFVGTLEVVKIYKGGENFDGSILTAALRKVGTGDDGLSRMLKWLSCKCTVPYDLSAQKDVVIPNNHRLMNPGHDPLFGLLFAVADILLGTATVIDNDGHLRIIIRSKEYPPQEKYLAVIFYLGHLVSDICTARGLPIPGFFMTQFFTNGNDDRSIARIAEEMYQDGYDLRHLASMSTPVFVKNTIIDTYIRILKNDNIRSFGTIAEKEIRNNMQIAYKYRMRLVSDAVCCGGNALKFFLPPTTGNITALNLPEWISVIKNILSEMKYQIRDKSVEQAIFNREIISDNWRKLLQ